MLVICYARNHSGCADVANIPGDLKSCTLGVPDNPGTVTACAVWAGATAKDPWAAPATALAALSICGVVSLLLVAV